jgi:hypothetical protein
VAVIDGIVHDRGIVQVSDKPSAAECGGSVLGGRAAVRHRPGVACSRAPLPVGAVRISGMLHAIDDRHLEAI